MHDNSQRIKLRLPYVCEKEGENNPVLGKDNGCCSRKDDVKMNLRVWEKRKENEDDILKINFSLSLPVCVYLREKKEKVREKENNIILEKNSRSCSKKYIVKSPCM